MMQAVMSQIEQVHLLQMRQQHIQLQQFGLTLKQYRVLELLSTKEVGHPSAMSEEIQVDRPTMTVILKNLEKSNWIQRETHDLNRRYVRVVLTDEGREKYEAMSSVINGNDKFDVLLSTEEQEVITNLLVRIKEYFE